MADGCHPENEKSPCLGNVLADDGEICQVTHIASPSTIYMQLRFRILKNQDGGDCYCKYWKIANEFADIVNC